MTITWKQRDTGQSGSEGSRSSSGGGLPGVSLRWSKDFSIGVTMIISHIGGTIGQYIKCLFIIVLIVTVVVLFVFIKCFE